MLRSLSVALFSILQVSRAIDVYLHPHTGTQPLELPSERASFALAHHLDLEMFEPLPQHESVYYEEIPLFGQGAGKALVVTLETSDAIAVLPEELNLSYTLDSHPEVQSLDSVLYTMLSRAKSAYNSIYENSGPMWQLSQLDVLSSFLDSEESGFAAIELRELSKLRSEYGTISDEYRHHTRQLREFLRRAMTSHDKLRLAIITFDARNTEARGVARQEQSPLPSTRPPPQQPIGSVSTCFRDKATCQNATNSCSGRGQCAEATKAGRSCFVCLCGVTRTGEGAKTKTEIWAGERCEKKDISAPFVLLTGTVLVLVVLIASSVSLLSGVGKNELPSTLLSTTVSTKKD